MRSTSFYRPCAVLAKAALLADTRRRFARVIVENDRGTIVLSGVVDQMHMVRDAGTLAAKASGSLVLNRVVVAE